MFQNFKHFQSRTTGFFDEEEREGPSNGSAVEFKDLAPNGVFCRKTLRLVECSMLAAVTGLVYFLSNSLAIENYFGCFFSLPIVISSIRWGVACGRKQLVATVMLLFVLSGPLKALNYLCLLCVLAAPLVFSVPYENGDEGFIEIAKMVGEGYIMEKKAKGKD